MSVVIKYKLSDVAKDLNVQNKELIDFCIRRWASRKSIPRPLQKPS